MFILKKLRLFLSRHGFFYLVSFLIALLMLIYFLGMIPGHDWGDDFAAYILHAQNIAEGRPYADIKFIQNPFNWIAPKAYPPVFPFLLSIVYRFFGLNLLAMKIMVLLFWGASLFLLFYLLRGRLPPVLIGFLLLLVGLYPYIYFLLKNVLSEASFIFFTLLSLCVAEYLYSDRNQYRRAYGFFALGGLMYLSYGTRAIGAALVPAVFFYDLIKYRRIGRGTFLSVAVFFVLAMAQTALGIDTVGYLSHCGFTVGSCVETALKYFSFFCSLSLSFTDKLFFWITTYFCILGFCGILRYKFSLVELFCLFYLSIVFFYALPNASITPFDIYRLFVPLIPFYFYYLFYGVEQFFSFFNKKIVLLLLAVLATSMIYAQIGLIVRTNRFVDFDKFNVAKKGSVDLFSYIKKNTQPEDVFIFSKPRALTLFTQRPASAYCEHKDFKDFLNYSKKIEARHVVVIKRYDAYLNAVMASHNAQYKKVYENQDFQVFKLMIF